MTDTATMASNGQGSRSEKQAPKRPTRSGRAWPAPPAREDVQDFPLAAARGAGRAGQSRRRPPNGPMTTYALAALAVLSFGATFVIWIGLMRELRARPGKPTRRR